MRSRSHGKLRSWRAFWTPERRRRFAIGLAALVLFGPVLLILPLRLVDPPLTALMLGRAIDRSREDKNPAFPARLVVPLSAISPELKRAILASEDDAFYLHHGFDVRQIEKAMESNRRRRHVHGASTISQQTVKNLFL
jgi:monofunctional glycosyltransferase